MEVTETYKDYQCMGKLNTLKSEKQSYLDTLGLQEYSYLTKTVKPRKILHCFDPTET